VYVFGVSYRSGGNTMFPQRETPTPLKALAPRQDASL
jgi:hypothetical protein